MVMKHDFERERKTAYRIIGDRTGKVKVTQLPDASSPEFDNILKGGCGHSQKELEQSAICCGICFGVCLLIFSIIGMIWLFRHCFQ